MAAAPNAANDSVSANSCCAPWKARCSELQEKRQYLRSGIQLLNQQVKKLEDEILKLKKECEEERARANAEREEREKETCSRISMDTEIASLKSEISSLQKGVASQGQVANSEAELDRLKQLVEEERAKVGQARDDAELEKKKASELEKEVIQAKSSLKLERSMFAEAKKKLEVQQKKVLEEKMRADANGRKATEERGRADNLLKELQDEKQKAQKFKKLLSCESTDTSDSRCDFDVAMRNMQAHISEKAEEVSQLKQLLEEEKMNVDLEREKADAAKTKVSELLKALEYEKNLSNEAWKSVESASNKAKESRNQLETLQKEVKEARSNLAFEKSKYEEAKKKFEMEKQKFLRETRHAHEEKEKAIEQKRLMEVHEKIAIKEQNNAANLLKALEAEKAKVEKLQKEKQELMLSFKSAGATGSKVDAVTQSIKLKEQLLSVSLKPKDTKREIDAKKMTSEQAFIGSELNTAVERFEVVDNMRAMVQTWDSGDLPLQLGKARQTIKELEAELYQVQYGGMVNNKDSIQTNTTQHSEVRLLEEQLKLEKMRKKHSKQVAKLEKHRNDILCYELDKLKHELGHMLQRLNLIDMRSSHGSICVGNQEVRSSMCNMLSDSSRPRLSGIDRSHMLLDEVVIRKPIDAHDCLIPLVNCNDLQRCHERLSGTKTNSDTLHEDSHGEILPSSAISSGAASFSNQQLVGSQGKLAGSLATSASLAEVLSTPLPMPSSRSMDIDKRKPSDNIAAVEKNTLGISAFQGSMHKRRKIICDEVESIKRMQQEGQRLHHEMEEKLAMLQIVLSELTDEPMENHKCLRPDQKSNACTLQEGPHKKRKVACETKEIMEQYYDYDEHINMGTCVLARVANTGSGTCEDDSERHLSNQVADLIFEKLAEEDVMKLLELDNLADEEMFLVAMERPLSPTLPEINFANSEGFKVEGLKCCVEESYCDGILINKYSVGKPCSFNVPEDDLLRCNNKVLEKSKVFNNVMETKGSDSSEIDLRLPNETSRNCTYVSKFCTSDEDSGILEVQISANNVTNFSCGLQIGSAKAGINLFCIMFSDMEAIESATKIFSATRTCAAQRFLSSQRRLTLHDLLLALASEKCLKVRENVCVLFSLFLEHCCAVSSSNYEDLNGVDLVAHVSANVHSALSEVDLSTLFGGLCNLSELVSLIEDFVISKRIFSEYDSDSEPRHGCNTKMEISLDGRRVLISSKPASTTQLVTAGLILAFICSVLDQIHYVCEFSFSILHMSSKEPFLVLSILHGFAHVCREEYLTMSKYSSLIAVVKTVVMLIESASEIVIHPEGSILPCFPHCASCPFSEGSDSVDDMLSLLLEELEGDTLADLKRSASFSGFQPLFIKNGRPSCCSTNVAVTPGFPNSGFIRRFCRYNDALSLLELISSIMVWDWTCKKILPRLFKLLESDILGSISVSVVLLLGQMGRLRIEASGDKDDGIEHIKRGLSSFLCRIVSLKADPSLVTATAAALFELSSLSPQELMEDTELQIEDCHSAADGIIRSCFSWLSSEQKMFLYSLQVGPPQRMKAMPEVQRGSPIAAIVL